MPRRSTVFMALGLLLMVGAAALTGYNGWENARAAESAQCALEQMQLPRQMHPAGQLRQPLPDAGEPIPEMPTEVLDGREYIGVLEIPGQNLTLPVMADWSYEQLRTAPCRYTGSYFTGDLVICGHNYPAHFQRIRTLGLNADVLFTTVDGVQYHYVVDDIQTVAPEDVEGMTTGSWDLTLFTCYTGGGTRCAVRCILAPQEMPKLPGASCS